MKYWLFFIFPIISVAFQPYSLPKSRRLFLLNSYSPRHPKNIWEFSRPHTLLGTGVSIFSTFHFANPHSFSFSYFLWVLSLCSMMNIYITGINQIYDLSIDHINKPDLVLPSGRMNKKTAKLIIKTALLSSLSLSILPISLNRPPLFFLLLSSALFGTIYSVPPLRLKVNPFSALFCIVSVRGFLIPSLMYLYALAEPIKYMDIIKISGSVFYFSILSILIAIMKDIPDHKGDITYGIETFTLQYGSSKVMFFSKIIHRILSFMAGIIFFINLHKNFVILSPPQMFVRIMIMVLFFGMSIKSLFSHEFIEKSYQRLWDFFYFSYLSLLFL